MKKITVNLKERSYPIFVGAKLEKLGSFLAGSGFTKNALVVTNLTVGKLYLSRISSGLKRSGFKVSFCVIPDGEAHKSLGSVNKIYTAMLKNRLDRRSPLIALGGGVIGDTAGFAAATYMRGVPLVQAPTTLLAMVDASIGGKTGVDLKEGKNLIGSFYQPKAVWIDISTLKTLPEEHVANGMAEVIKYGVIHGLGFFGYLEKNIASIAGCFGTCHVSRATCHAKSDTGQGKATAVLEHVIETCCKIKSAVVSKDEREEKGLREILNFGHTFGHALEKLHGFKGILHGQAVAVGMNFAASLAVALKMIKPEVKARIKDLVINAGLGACALRRFSAEQLIAVMMRDKKTRSGKLRFVLPVKIGKVVVKSNIPVEVIKEVIK